MKTDVIAATPQDLKSFISSLRKPGLPLCFRGVSNADWSLTPTMFRHEEGVSILNSRREVLSEVLRIERDLYRDLFRRGDRHLQGLTPLEKLVKAQHYGCPTRLLDWSSKVDVAVFFAVEANIFEDGALYILDPAALEYPKWVGRPQFGKTLTIDNLSKRDLVFLPGDSDARLKAKDDEQPFDDFLALLTPPHGEPRVERQGGLFTIVVNQNQDQCSQMLVDCSYFLRDLEVRIGSRVCWKVCIPRSVKRDWLEELADGGLLATDIYPDMTGLSMVLAKERKDLLRLRVSKR